MPTKERVLRGRIGFDLSTHFESGVSWIGMQRLKEGDTKMADETKLAEPAYPLQP